MKSLNLDFSKETKMTNQEMIQYEKAQSTTLFTKALVLLKNHDFFFNRK